MPMRIPLSNHFVEGIHKIYQGMAVNESVGRGIINEKTKAPQAKVQQKIKAKR